MRQVFAPHLGHYVKLGGRRLPRGGHVYAPRATNYVAASLPAAPSSTNFRTKYDAALKQVYLNDTEGDCVIAARYHRIGQLTTLATGTAFVATKAQINADYSRVGGFVPGDASTDQGCDMIVNNNDGVSHGYADGSKDLGWLVVDATNKTLLQQLVWIFEGGIDLGISLPDAWVDPFPAADGAVWDVAGAPNPMNGHDVPIIDFDAKGVLVVSWGLVIYITWAALGKYLAPAAGGEAYLHVNPDMLAKGQTKCPNGFDWSAVISDFDSVGGHIPAPTPVTPPAPAPAPAPAPTPSKLVTLAQAQGWASAGLAASWPK